MQKLAKSTQLKINTNENVNTERGLFTNIQNPAEKINKLHKINAEKSGESVGSKNRNKSPLNKNASGDSAGSKNINKNTLKKLRSRKMSVDSSKIFNLLLKKDYKIKLSWKEIICPVFCINDMKKRDMFIYGENRITEQLSISNLIKKINEMEKLKFLVLNEEQLALLPVVKYNNCNNDEQREKQIKMVKSLKTIKDKENKSEIDKKILNSLE
jgi:hypothetical protein